MEQMKRLRSVIIDDGHNDTKRKTTNVIEQKNITVFEDLSNEVIYEIFEYLDMHHAFQAFYDLNKQFQNLFTHYNAPIKINISLISKSICYGYFRNFLTPHTHQIRLIRLSNPFIADTILLLLPLMKTMIQLETLILNDIEVIYIEKILRYLSLLPVLSSLTITSIDYVKNRNNIYQNIFRLSSLKYCQILIETFEVQKQLPIATNEFSPIEHLIINHTLSINELNNLLSYVPQLRRLSVNYLKEYQNFQSDTNSITLNYLTNVSLKMHTVSFDNFQLLVREFFQQVQILHLVIYYAPSGFLSLEYLNAKRWEELISTYMLHLNIFDFQHDYYGSHSTYDSIAYKDLVEKFNSLFWIERQWFFSYQYHRKEWSTDAIFYSLNRYRKKDYILYRELIKNISPRSFELLKDPIHHIYIQSTNFIKNNLDDFPYITELTLCQMFDGPYDSIAYSLNRIIPLRQLTKLNLDCHCFLFIQIIKFLQFTPNVHTLKLDSILFDSIDFLSIQQNPIFNFVSQTNKITNLTITTPCVLKEIELLISLFSRLEYLTINANQEELIIIILFLLSKSHNNTRYLSSLCFTIPYILSMNDSKLMFDLKRLLHNHTMKIINRKLYIWW